MAPLVVGRGAYSALRWKGSDALLPMGSPELSAWCTTPTMNAKCVSTSTSTFFDVSAGKSYTCAPEYTSLNQFATSTSADRSASVG